MNTSTQRDKDPPFTHGQHLRHHSLPQKRDDYVDLIAMVKSTIIVRANDALRFAASADDEQVCSVFGFHCNNKVGETDRSF